MSDTCGAKTRAGTPCKHQAGWGTDHVGEGKCRLHGGRGGRPASHGRYSVKARNSLADKLTTFREDERPADLSDELSMMRALFQNFLDKHPNPEPEDHELMFEMLDTISRLVERIHRIFNENALTAAELNYFQARLADIIVKYIDDPERRQQCLVELRESFEPRRLA